MKKREWNIKTLKEHLEILIKERDLKMQQHFESLDRAVNKAETATEKRFESVNEFRSQLADQSRTFIPRLEVEGLLKSMNDKISDLAKLIEKIDNQKSGASLMLAYIISGICALTAVISIIINILK